MSAPIISPDGNFIWTGSEWIPNPPSLSNNNTITDSVVMGGIVNQTTYVVGNNQGKIENYLKLMLDNYTSGNKIEGLAFFKDAQKINYVEALRIYESEYKFKINQLRCQEMNSLLNVTKDMRMKFNNPHMCLGQWTIMHDCYLEVKNDNSEFHVLEALNNLVKFIEIWYDTNITQSGFDVEDYLLAEYRAIRKENIGTQMIAKAKELRKSKQGGDLAGAVAIFIFGLLFLLFVIALTS